MAHQAWVISLVIVLGGGLVYSTWWTRGGRGINRQIRAQAERDMEAKIAAQLAESHGHTGHVRALGAEEIAEIQHRYGPHVHVRSITAEQAAEMNEKYGRHYRRRPDR